MLTGKTTCDVNGFSGTYKYTKKLGSVGVMTINVRVENVLEIYEGTMFFNGEDWGEVIMTQKRGGKFYWSGFNEFRITKPQ